MKSAVVLSATVIMLLLLVGSLAIFFGQSLSGGKTVSSFGRIKETQKFEVLNVDGNLSLPEAQDTYYWNPHKSGSPSAQYNIAFSEEAVMHVRNVARESGHIAAGAWYNRSFVPNGSRIPLDRDIFVEFDALIEGIYYEPNEWFRLALANEFHVFIASSVPIIYRLELDFWDGPTTFTGQVGDEVFASVDRTAIGLHMDQLQTGVWKHYKFNMLEIVRQAWNMPNFPYEPRVFYNLFASYIKIDYNKTIVETSLHVKNLTITRPIEPKLPIPYQDQTMVTYLRNLVRQNIPIVNASASTPPLTDVLPRVRVVGNQLFAGSLPVVLVGGGEDYLSYDSVTAFEQLINNFKPKYSRFNVVRLSFSMLVSQDSAHSPFNFTLLDSVLAFLETKGVYAILDAHHFWVSHLYEDAWVNQWREIAKYYENRTVIAAFEVVNEPARDFGMYYETYLGGLKISPPWLSSATGDQCTRVADAIWGIDPDRIIVMNMDFIDPAMLPSLFMTKRNVIWTTHQWADNLPAATLIPMAQRRAEALSNYQNQYNIPIWIGEFGVRWSFDLAGQDAWFKFWVNTSKANGWQYTVWNLRDTHYESYGYWDYAFA